MEQLIFLVIVALISLINWIFREGGLKDSLTGKQPPQSDGRSSGPPAARMQERQGSARRAETEEERVRRFMDALGLPTTEEPPTPVQPQQAPPPVPVERAVQRKAPDHPNSPPVAVPSMEVADAYEDKKHDIGQALALSKAEQEVLDRLERGEDTNWDVPLSTAQQREPGGRAALSGVRAMLSRRDSLKQAVVLKEILDQPRGLQSVPGPTTGV